MKYLINVFLWIALAALLTISGAPCNTWQYWAVLACVFCMCINIMLW